jgi:hypothetical protein
MPDDITLACRKCGQTSRVPVTTSAEKLFPFLMIAFWFAILLLAGSALNALWPSFHLARWATGSKYLVGTGVFTHLPQFVIVVAVSMTASAMFVRFVLGVKAGMRAKCGCGSSHRVRVRHLRAGRLG